MVIGINPTVDFACKKVLGSPDHPAITLHFLNAILGGEPRIAQVTILNPIVDKDYEADKLSILDILATDETGRRLNIEVQRGARPGLSKRLTYYAASQLVDQLGEGDNYLALRPSISICILDGTLFPRVPDLHLDFQLINPQNLLVLSDCLQVHLLELPKYRVPNDNELIENPIEQWCYFFRRACDSTPEELTRRLVDPVFAEAAGVLKMIARDPKQRSLYQARMKMEMDERFRLQAAKEEGLAEGLAEGEARGEARGRVRILQQLIGTTISSDSELASKSLADLAAMEADLQRQFQERRIV
jgi:predicted transposase/invertase (TIGR01784 family)